jgi:hypothetical protein
MTPTTLSTTQAQALYDHGLAILPDTWTLVTRNGYYEWDATQQAYACTHGNLRVQHQTGTRWNGRRFVRCACTSCRRVPADQWGDVAPASPPP